MHDAPQHSKKDILKKRYCFNAHANDVRDELFCSDTFFDPHDLPQVKYEMLRRVQRENRAVSKAAADFGFSRVSFYQAQAAFNREGLSGLLPRKRGPQDRHKLTSEVMRFVNDIRMHDEKIGPLTIAQRIKQRFSVTIHPRSIQRALAAQKKKRHSQHANTNDAA